MLAKGLLKTGHPMYSCLFRLVYGKRKKQVRRVGHLIVASAAPLTNPYFALSYLLMPLIFFFGHDCYWQDKFVCAVRTSMRQGLPMWKKIMGLLLTTYLLTDLCQQANITFVLSTRQTTVYEHVRKHRGKSLAVCRAVPLAICNNSALYAYRTCRELILCYSRTTYVSPPAGFASMSPKPCHRVYLR